MKSCWHRTPSLRPQASEIVELLTNNPRLIQPCVGIPLSSIQIEGSNSLELQIPSAVACQIRKSASNSNKFSLTCKLANLDIPLSGNSGPGLAGPANENLSDPLLIHSYSSSHFVTQYITLQHGINDQCYDSRDGTSSQV